MKRLEKLKNYPSKILIFDKETGVLSDIRDEKKEESEKRGHLNHFIKNYSGGIPIKNVLGQIVPLREHEYSVLEDDVGGDAPKDFIQVYKYEKGRKIKPSKWDKHIAKIGHKWYPLESISEHLLNRIGEVLNLDMAESQLRVAHGQLRFLSKYFLKPEQGENLIHGAQIYSAYLEAANDDFVKEIESEDMARTLLTFQVTQRAIQFVFPNEYEEIMRNLVKLLIFDALTGNNDRHFYNWAVITDIEGKLKPRFSPIYDSARGLLWNFNENLMFRKFFIVRKKNKIEVNHLNLETYLQSSRPKIGWDNWNKISPDGTEINHFQLIGKIIKDYPLYKNICIELTKSVYLQNIHDMLDVEFKTFYTPERYKLIRACLSRRFEILQQMCKP